MNEYSVPVDVHQREIDDPVQVLGRDRPQIGQRRALVIGCQRLTSPVPDPPVEFGPVLTDRTHHGFVVALQIDDLQFIRPPVHETLDDLPALRPTVDVVAQGYDRGRQPLRMPDDRVNCAIQEIQPAMKVGYGVCSAHGNLRQEPVLKRNELSKPAANEPPRRKRMQEHGASTVDFMRRSEDIRS